MVIVCAQSLNCVWLVATPWTVACQAPLSMGLSWQECWSVIVQETGIKTIPKKKKCKKAKWLSEEPYKYLWKEGKWKAKKNRKDIPIWMWSSKEKQGEIKTPSLVIDAKK